jgi:hypothetical protein
MRKIQHVLGSGFGFLLLAAMLTIGFACTRVDDCPLYGGTNYCKEVSACTGGVCMYNTNRPDGTGCNSSSTGYPGACLAGVCNLCRRSNPAGGIMNASDCTACATSYRCYYGSCLSTCTYRNPTTKCCDECKRAYNIGGTCQCLPDHTLDHTWCGGDTMNYCYNGTCVGCDVAASCPNQTCMVTTCDSNKCTYDYATNGTSCGSGLACYLGNCWQCARTSGCAAIDCRVPTCNSTHQCHYTIATNGTSCASGTKACYSGNCWQCARALDCTNEIDCRVTVCNSTHQCNYATIAPNRTLCHDDTKYCYGGVCSECGPVTDCPTQVCHDRVCNNGTCGLTLQADGTSCGGGNVCYSGSCVQCFRADNCAAQTCKSAVCTDNVCVYTNVANGTDCGTGLQCYSGNCWQCAHASDCPDNVECRVPSCNATHQCSYHSHATNRTLCDGDTKYCYSGACHECGLATDCPTQPCRDSTCVNHVCGVVQQANRTSCGCGANISCAVQTQCQRAAICDITTRLCTVINHHDGHPCDTCTGDPLSCLCIGGQCVSRTCSDAEDCPVQDENCVASAGCAAPYCTRTNAPDYSACGDEDDRFCSAGDCVACAVNGDCSPVVGSSDATCVNGECEYLPLGILGMCFGGNCWQCAHALDCPAIDCYVASCNVTHQCKYTAAANRTLCNGGTRYCYSGSCRQCGLVTDCPTQVCHDRACNNGTCSPTMQADSTPCGGGNVCANGNCVQCARTADCAAQTCKSVVCTANVCVYTDLANGTTCGSGLKCYGGNCWQCARASDCAPVDCRIATCTAHTCGWSTYAANRTLCAGGTQYCYSGTCHECGLATDCPTQTCYDRTCISFRCGLVMQANRTSCGGSNLCVNGNCVACQLASDCSAPSCQVATCTAGVCSSPPAPSGTSCTSGSYTWVCNGNSSCVPCTTYVAGGNHVGYVPDATQCTVGGYRCYTGRCLSGCTGVNASYLCPECLTPVVSGSPATCSCQSKPDAVVCSNGRFCYGGVCSQCTSTANCTAQTCRSVVCTAGQCVYTILANGTNCGTEKACYGGNCWSCAHSSDCAAVDCYTASCTVNHLCAYNAVANRTRCTADGYCYGGSCWECGLVTDCPTQTCYDRYCGIGHRCGLTMQANRTSCGGSNLCVGGSCVACQLATDCPAPPTCQVRNCNAGVCVNTASPSGTACTSGSYSWVCNGNSSCVPCTTYVAGGNHVGYVPDGTQCTVGGNRCYVGTCVAGCTGANATYLCPECKMPVIAVGPPATCSCQSKPNNTACSEGRACLGGVCSECTRSSECATEICKEPTCTLGQCTYTDLANETVCGTGMKCYSGNCWQCAHTSECPDSVECHVPLCNATHECDYGGNTANRTRCNVGTWYCYTGVCLECGNPADCPSQTCYDRTCGIGGRCGLTVQADRTPCGGSNLCVGGNCVACQLASDCPTPPTCQVASCDAGVCSNVAATSGTSCTSGSYNWVCNGNSSCVPCTTYVAGGNHVGYVPDATQCTVGGYRCYTGRCLSGCTGVNASHLCPECYAPLVSGSPANCSCQPVANETVCSNGRLCYSGVCSQCTRPADCPTLTCRTTECVDGQCAYTIPVNGTSCGTGLACYGGNCWQCAHASDCPDNVECRVPSCNATHQCSYHTNAANRTLCNVGAWYCYSGTCRECGLATDCPTQICHDGTCGVGGTCRLVAQTDRTPCGGSNMCVGGNCVACQLASDCPDPPMCKLASCVVGVCSNITAPLGTPCINIDEESGVCVANLTCAPCTDPAIDCPHMPCYTFVCGEGDRCEIATSCPDGHCLPDNVTCVECVEPLIDCAPIPCYDMACSGNHTCTPVPTCAEDHCLPTGNATECVECVDPEIDCEPTACYDAACSPAHACTYSRTCPADHCIGGTCVECVDAEEDCPPYECLSPACYGHTCWWSFLETGTPCGTGDDQYCFEGACIPCLNATRDCAAQQCRTPSCSAGQCDWSIAAQGTSCDEIENGHCNVTGDCVECTEDSHCVHTGCGGSCHSGQCLFICGSGCTHAIGWWYIHTDTAFVSPVAPVTTGGGVVITTPAELKAFLHTGFGAIGLDSLNVALVLARLNIAAGASQSPTLATTMLDASIMLTLCPPGNSTVWNQVLMTSHCGGYSVFDIQSTIQDLFRFTNGHTDVPLCNDIGSHQIKLTHAEVCLVKVGPI